MAKVLWLAPYAKKGRYPILGSVNRLPDSLYLFTCERSKEALSRHLWEADDFATYLNSRVNWSTVCDTSLVSRLPAAEGAGFYVQVMTMRSLNDLPNPRAKLRNSPVPVLVLKGQCDNQKWVFTNEYLRLFPHHKLVIIPDAGHFIFFEQPQLYLSAIGDFLKSG